LSNIRVTYSGLIAFVIGLLSVGTGLVFTLIITRRLAPEEFGTWALIGTMISYFLISEAIIDFWTFRQVVRGEKVGKTSLFSSALFSLASIPLYMILAFIISDQSKVDFNILVLGFILLPVYFLSQALTQINSAFQPQKTSYSLMIFEISKIPTALSFVYFLDLGVIGAIIAILIAYIIKIGFQLYFAKSKLKDRLNFQFLKRWFKFSWISLYSQFPKLLTSLDIFLYTLITGSVIGIAFYSAAFVISNLVAHSSLISQALFPKLLAKGSHEHINENFSLLMYFAIPLLGLSVIFSKPALFALNPAYIDGTLIVILLSFKTFFLVLDQTLQRILVSIDTVDVEVNPKFRSLLKSNLFHMSTVRFIKVGIYLFTFVTTLVLLHTAELDEVFLVTIWALITLIIEIPFFIYMWILTKRYIKFSFPYVSTLKYLGTTLAFGIVFVFASEQIIIYHESIFNFLPTVILMFVICVGIYLLITYLIDNKTKKLFKSIINEIS